jgi:glycosyltransferase involved in cell wall biosynthesis
MRIALLTTDNRQDYRDYNANVPYFGTAPEALLRGFECFPEVEFQVLSCTQQAVAAPEKLAGNIFFHSLVVPRLGWGRTAFQGCVRAVRRKLAAIRPNLVHGQGTERDCAISAVLSGYPNVITVHGNMRRLAEVTRARAFTYWWLAARLEAFTLPRSHGVICLTRHSRAEVSSLAKRTWIVPNALPLSFFESNSQRQPVDPPRLLCVGNVCEVKNQNALIRGLDGLASKRAFRLVFLGRAQRGEPYADEFFRLMEARPWCVWEGFADRNQLQRAYREATLLVLPSLEENCPMAVLEAMAVGLPVVAARVGGVPDLVVDGETGFLCDPQDGGSMGLTVEKALAPDSPAARVATQARERARKRFHPETVARRHIEIYQEVLKPPATLPASGPASLGLRRQG